MHVKKISARWRVVLTFVIEIGHLSMWGSHLTNSISNLLDGDGSAT